jgi:hypothetical protein
LGPRKIGGKGWGTLFKNPKDLSRISFLIGGEYKIKEMDGQGNRKSSWGKIRFIFQPVPARSYLLGLSPGRPL